MQRFYREVTVEATEAGYGVRLDGKSLRTPAKRPLELATPQLAQAIAEEWAAQDGTIKPDTMRLMKLASTAIDHVAAYQHAVAEETLKYGGTDLLCYRAHEPESLVARQAEAWQPLLDWASLAFDAPLTVTDAILPIEQPASSLAALKSALHQFDAMRLTAIADLTAACGSLILALAAAEHVIDAERCFELALLDEHFQIERWGIDAEAAVRLDRLKSDIAAAVRFLALLDAVEA
jgi:chaperone required for assembly of F1-ATPase